MGERARTDRTQRAAGGRPDGRPPAPAGGRTAGRRPPPHGAARTAARTDRRTPRVRVELLLDDGVLEDLELLRRYRHGPESRSQVVREAIDWLRAKEAAWLIRAQRAERRRQQRERELELARRLPRETRDRADVEELVEEALAIARAWLQAQEHD